MTTLPKHTVPTKVIIDTRAFSHNLARVKFYAPDAHILAMVKSDAYGHGAAVVAKALCDVDGFGVARLQEALLLREVGITKPIFLMGGFFHTDELQAALQLNLTVVIQNAWQLSEVLKTPLEKSLSVWLKINTGMNRLGLPLADVASARQRLDNCLWVQKPYGMMTHLSDADALDQQKTHEQIKRFDAATRHFKGPLSIANSAALIACPESRRDWVRPGIMLYGISPFSNKAGIELGLKPAMTLKSQLIAVQTVKPGETVGYGGAWVASQETRIGIAAIGYGDGYPRSAKSGTPVLVAGKRCTLAGRVSMDMMTIDLSAAPNAHLGEEVILWGNGLPIEEVARFSDTIAYELALKLTSRVKYEILQTDKTTVISTET